jgi:hypothetical protein
MEGLLFVVGALAVLFLATRWGGDLFARQVRRGPEQEVEPPGERSAPDDWPRDGGDNPRAP